MKLPCGPIRSSSEHACVYAVTILNTDHATGYVSITTLGTQLVTYRFRVVIFIHKFITHYLIEEGECYAVGMLFSIGGVTPGGGTPYSGLYGEPPPKRGGFFKLAVYRYKRGGKIAILVYERVMRSAAK